MKSKAAVAFKAGAPLEIAEVDVQGPRAGEVMVEIKATGVCHTDAFTLCLPAHQRKNIVLRASACLLISVRI